jgi:hypothetical protein
LDSSQCTLKIGYVGSSNDDSSIVDSNGSTGASSRIPSLPYGLL